jgi:hypothetical protein
VSLFTTYGLAFTSCFDTMTTFTAAPTTQSATEERAKMQRKFWQRSQRDLHRRGRVHERSSLPGNQRPAPVSGVSLQPITDMRATIEAIAGATNAPNVADRTGAAQGLAAAQAMSKDALTKHGNSHASVDQELRIATSSPRSSASSTAACPA